MHMCPRGLSEKTEKRLPRWMQKHEEQQHAILVVRMPLTPKTCLQNSPSGPPKWSPKRPQNGPQAERLRGPLRNPSRGPPRSPPKPFPRPLRRYVFRCFFTWSTKPTKRSKKHKAKPPKSAKSLWSYAHRHFVDLGPFL